MGERRRETEKEREKGSETDVPKLYPTMNMNSLCLDCSLIYLNIGTALNIRIKSISWEYSCDGEYLEEFNKGKFFSKI